MNDKQIERIVMIVAPCGILLCSMYFYYMTPIGKLWGYQFPSTQVLQSIPISFLMWGFCAWIDPPKYRNICSFVGCSIFGCTVMTAAFLIGTIK